jgi:transcriptional regulator with PAS, ATPase and Fis domain
MPEDPQGAPSSIQVTMIRTALELAHGDKILAAKLLGISQADLQRWMRTFGFAEDGLSEG